MKRKDPLTRWIEQNCGTSDPTDFEIEVKETEKKKEPEEKKYEEIMKDFHNSFVGE